MNSLWTGLLFLHGHIRDPELVRRLADTPSHSPSGRVEVQVPAKSLVVRPGLSPRIGNGTKPD